MSQSSQHTDVVLLRAFAHINQAGIEGRTGEAHLTLRSGDAISIRAGGPGINSTPAAAPFTAYEVLSSSDTEPPYWRKYTDTAGVVYAHVPPLLITHFCHRSGGITDYLFETSTREVTEILDVKIQVPSSARTRLFELIGEVGQAVVLRSSMAGVRG